MPKKPEQLTQKAARVVVRDALRWPIGSNLPPLNRRYPWLRDKLVPALRVLEHGGKRDRGLAALGYFELGDTFSFCFWAREAAVRAYRHPVRLDPQFGLAWHEIGFELELLGDPHGAQRAYRKAVTLAPDNETREWWKGDIQPLSPEYIRKINDQSDKLEEAHRALEYLAEFKPEKTLVHIRHLEFETTLRCAAYSALGDWASCLREWEKRVPTREESPEVLTRMDDYFCTHQIVRSPEYWKIMIKVSRNCQASHIPYWRELGRLIPARKIRAGSNPTYFGRRLGLAARLKLAETSKDLRLARTICRQYPDWKDAKKVLTKLQRQLSK